MCESEVLFLHERVLIARQSAGVFRQGEVCVCVCVCDLCVCVCVLSFFPPLLRDAHRSISLFISLLVFSLAFSSFFLSSLFFSPNCGKQSEVNVIKQTAALL